MPGEDETARAIEPTNPGVLSWEARARLAEADLQEIHAIVDSSVTSCSLGGRIARKFGKQFPRGTT